MLAVLNESERRVTLYRRVDGVLVYWRTITGDASALARAVAAARALCDRADALECGPELQPGLLGFHAPKPPKLTRVNPGVLPVCRVNGALRKLQRPRRRYRVDS